MFVPKLFFETRKRLVVSKSFLELVLSVASPIKLAPMATLASFDITKTADDKVNADATGGVIFENVDTLCLQLAEMLLIQWNGYGGVLLVDGKANTFYTGGTDDKILEVRAKFIRLGREWEWYVDASQFGETGSDEGDRVFTLISSNDQSAKSPPAQRRGWYS